MNSPSISVVIPACDRPELLSRCLARLHLGVEALERGLCEVIVSDGSQEGDVRLCLEGAFPWVRYVKGPRKGPAANRNCGARFSRAEWIIFLDDDCVPDVGLLQAYYAAFKEYSETQAFEGVIYSERPQRSLHEGCPINEKGGCFWSCNIAFKRDFFNQIGGFDERFPYPAYEDMDLHYRVRALGVEIRFVQGARVMHPWKQLTVWKRFKQQRISSQIYLDKHPEEKKKHGSDLIMKIALMRLLKVTLPGSIQFRGRGFLPALAFDVLDLFFGLGLFLKGVFRFERF